MKKCTRRGLFYLGMIWLMLLAGIAVPLFVQGGTATISAVMQTLALGSTVTFTGTYQVASGTVVIDAQPSGVNTTAPWSLYGPDNYILAGMGDRTLPEMTAGAYTLAWGGVAGYEKPSPAMVMKTLASGSTVTFTGIYQAATGTVTINPEPDSINAPWTLYGPNSYSLAGTGDRTLTNMTAGAYTVVWGQVSNWNIPSPNIETKTLPIGGSMTFIGTYAQAPIIQVFPNPANFGSVFVGTTKDVTVWVNNVGTATLTGSVTTSKPFSVVGGGTYNVVPGQSQQMTLRYSPTQSGSHTGSASFTGGNGKVITLSGSANASASYSFLMPVNFFGGSGGGEGLFNYPLGVAADQSGFIYVTDTLNNRVQKFDANGNFIKMWGSQSEGFYSPIGVAVDGNGSVYIAQGNGGKVQKFTSDGEFILNIGTRGDGPGQFRGPMGLAVDPTGQYIYVTDSYPGDSGNRVHKFTTGGVHQRTWGSPGTGDGQFDYPSGIAVDQSGNVYVLDYGNNRIQKFDSEGNYLMKWDAGLVVNRSWPILIGIAVDSGGFIYVSDFPSGYVRKFNASGVFQGQLGAYGTGDGQFSSPMGIALDSAGNLYVADGWGGYRVQKITNAGVYLMKFGQFGGSGNGYFNGPLGVSAYTSGGNTVLYVADFWNARIQKLDTSGNYLGQWGTKGWQDGRFDYPIGVATDISGNVYVSEYFRVQKFDGNGNFILKLCNYGSGDGEVQMAHGIAVSPDGLYVYVADAGNQRVQKFTAAGAYVLQWGTPGTGNGQFNSPRGIVVDAGGYVYVSDEGPTGQPSRIQKFTAEGVFVASWNLGSSASTGWPRLYGLAFDGQGNLLAADTRNGQLYRYAPNGTPLNQWAVSGAQGLAVDPEGYIYVTDGPWGSNYINKYEITTIVPGWVQINPNPDNINAPWTLTGPDGAVTVGNGDWTVGVSVPGDYLLDWGNVAGYQKPVSETKAVASGVTITFTGNYQPIVGTVTVNPEPNGANAPWVLTGPYGFSRPGTGDWTLSGAVIGNYTVYWNGVAGYERPTPGQVVQTLAEGQTLTFTGIYQMATGTVVISPRPAAANAPWALTGPYGYTQTGTGAATVTGRQSGYYSLTWGDAIGWTKPWPATAAQSIPQGGTATFIGNYQTAGLLDQWQHQTVGTETLKGVVYSPDLLLFAAVGDAGTILTSPDGVAWTPRTSGTMNTLEKIAYGNGNYVAVGGNGTIVTSDDGSTWPSRSSGTGAALYGVAYGNNLFVAVGEGGTLLTSPDGIVWTPQSSGTTRALYGVDFGNGLFVALGAYSTVLTSPNGVDWTPRDSRTHYRLWRVAYGNGPFVALGDDGVSLTSPDGITWTPYYQGTGSSTVLNDIRFVNGLFVAVGPNGILLTSTNGAGGTWQSHPTGTTDQLESLTYGDGKLVVVGQSGAVLLSGVFTGLAVVSVEPHQLNAPWYLTRPGGYSYVGRGDYHVVLSQTGDYTLTWGGVSGWAKPSPAQVTQTLTEGSTVTFTGVYQVATGTVILIGDLDGNGRVDIRDAILGMQVVSGMTTIQINRDASVIYEDKIGMREAIYILQKVAGIR